MPFSAKFLKSASQEIEVNLSADFNKICAYIKKALEKCTWESPNVSLKDVDIYIHGSYANKTNIYYPGTLEIIVELKKTLDFDPDKLTSKDYLLNNNYFIDIPLNFTPRDFSQLFLNAINELTGGRAQEKNKSIYIHELEKVKYNVEITPCFSFNYFRPVPHNSCVSFPQTSLIDENAIARIRDKTEPAKTDISIEQDSAHASDTEIKQYNPSEKQEKFRGILIYDKSANANILSFPRLHAQNGQIKDIATKGNYKRCVRLFKTLNALNINEFDFIKQNIATGYFIECLLFNVPNQLFISRALQTDNKAIAASSNTKFTKRKTEKTTGAAEQSNRADMREIFNKVLNYLINCKLEEFRCQNMIWSLFGKASEFWQIDRAEKFLDSICRLHSVFPSNRISFM